MMKRPLHMFVRYTALLIAASVLVSGCNGKAPANDGETAAGSDASEDRKDDATKKKNKDSKKDKKKDKVKDETADKTNEGKKSYFAKCTNQHMNMQDGDYVTVEGVCYSFELDEKTAEQYPELANVINGINEDAYDEFVTAMSKASVMSLTRHMSGWDYPYSESEEAKVTRADDKAFSYNVTHYAYLGGAHGYLFFSSKTIDPATGKDIAFADVVKTVSDFPQICFDELLVQNPDLKGYFDSCPTDKENLLTRIKESVSGSDKEPVWSLSFDGIMMYFEDYAMGSYVAGSQIVKIPYEDHKDLFNADYFKYDGDIPDIDDCVKAKDIEEPIVIADDKKIMEVGYSRKYLDSYEDIPYSNGRVDQYEIGNEYPELKKKLDEFNKTNENRLDTDFGVYKKELAGQFENTYKNNDSYRVYTYGINQYLTRADKAVFSTVTAYETVQKDKKKRVLVGVNIDPDTGKDLALDEVVIDIKGLEKAFAGELADAEYPQKTQNDATNEFHKQIGTGNILSNEKLSWTVGYEGITFYCNSTVNFTLADFTDDAMTLFIPYSAHPELFVKKYTQAPAAYAYQLPVSGDFGTAVYCDTSYSGKYSHINIYPYTDEGGYVGGLTFGINGYLQRLSDFYADEMSLLFVKHPEGDCYIYVQGVLDDGYTRLRILDFSFDTMQERNDRGTLYCETVYYTHTDNESHGYIMTDPLDFNVRKTNDIFGLRSVHAKCCIDSLGYPVSKDKKWYFDLGDIYDIKAAKDIKSGSDKIAKGETVSPYCITLPDNDDNDDGEEKELKLSLKGKKKYKLKIERDKDNGRWTYDGTDITDLFEGNFYHP